MPISRTFLATSAVICFACTVPVVVQASTSPGWFIADCGPGPSTGWCAGGAAEEGWQPVSGSNSNNGGGDDDDDEDYADGSSNPGGSIQHDQSATSEVELDSYLNAELTGGSDGFSSLTMAMNASGAMEDVVFGRTFRVASNTDHEIQIWYDATKIDGVCVPVFDSEGSGSIAGEADVLGGEITLSVGGTKLFNTSAASTLGNAFQDTSNGVTVECDDATPTAVGKALVTVTNNVASTFS